MVSSWLGLWWDELEVIVRCPSFRAALLYEPPAVVVLLDQFHKIVFLERHLAVLTLERKLGFVHVLLRF